MALRNVHVELKLEVGGDTQVEVPGANVKSFRVDLASYGFTAEATFFLEVKDGSEPLFEKLASPALARATLSIEPYFKKAKGPLAPEPLAVEGIVTERRVLERVKQDDDGKPIEFRRYKIRFADPARVLWSQHYPCSLLADASLHEMIAAEVAEGIRLKYDWDWLEAKHAVLCVPLGADWRGASFYDFLLWLVRRGNGVFAYDAKAKSYTLAKAKSQEGAPLPLRRGDVARLEIVMPEPGRADARVLNSYTEAVAKEAIARTENGVAGLRRDVLLDTPVAAQVTAVKAIETDRLAAVPAGLAVTFKALPSTTVRPGLFVVFSDTRFGAQSFPFGKEYRVRSLAVRGEARDREPARTGDQVAFYDGEMRARLEPKDDPSVDLPPFRAPAWPIHAEGKIVSEVGEPNDRTWQFAEDKDTSLHSYTVNIPLWNKKVIAPFEPGLFPGHFFFPAWKNERVLVRLDFQAARIARFLEWAPLARLPLETQGNHVILGKNDKSHTSIKHVYTDAKPVFSIVRLNETDTQKWEVAEGSMVLEVKEDAAAVVPEPTFDVRVEVALAKGELNTSIGEGITSIEGGFGDAEGRVTGAIAAASAEVGGALESAASDINGKIDEVQGEMNGMRNELQGQTAELRARGEGAKAALNALLED